MVNHLGGRCVVLVLRAILPIFKEGSTLYMGARISILMAVRNKWKKKCSKSQVSKCTGSRNNGLQAPFFCEQQTLDQ